LARFLLETFAYITIILSVYSADDDTVRVIKMTPAPHSGSNLDEFENLPEYYGRARNVGLSHQQFRVARESHRVIITRWRIPPKLVGS